jgi:hypothetical protein
VTHGEESTGCEPLDQRAGQLGSPIQIGQDELNWGPGRQPIIEIDDGELTATTYSHRVDVLAGEVDSNSRDINGEHVKASLGNPHRPRSSATRHVQCPPTGREQLDKVVKHRRRCRVIGAR